MRSAGTPEPRWYSGRQRLARPSAARPGGGAPLTTTATNAWRCLTQTCGRNPNSEAAANQLAAMGYTNVRKYAEGKQDWREAGLPLEWPAGATGQQA